MNSRLARVLLSPSLCTEWQLFVKDGVQATGAGWRSWLGRGQGDVVDPQLPFPAWRDLGGLWEVCAANWYCSSSSRVW